MGRYLYDNWRPYVSVAERRRRAAKKIAKMKKTGREISPVVIAGRKIATTFWGKAWGKNLEAYSDYANRLPRGRTYVRNGSVIDLQIEAGRVRALVVGSDIYKIDIKIKPLAKKRWTVIKRQCAGQIDSLVEMLRGSIAKGVMEIVTRKGKGLFPSPRDISLSCSCPDWATMCKHVAATLYGVGARLDHEPELLFTLRGVDPAEMVDAAVDQPPTGSKPRKGRVLETDELSSVFGVDIDMDGVSADDVSTPARSARSAKAAKSAKSAKAAKSATPAKSAKRAKRAKATKKVRRAAQARKKSTAKTKKKRAQLKSAARKAAAKKPVAKKPATKTSARKAARKKATTTKTATRKAITRKTTAKKTATKKTAAKKKASTRKPTAKKAGNKAKR
jgi:uncharacterized Zn finger protein